MKIIQIFFILFLTTSAFALAPEQHLSNADDESRALKLFTEIKCITCQGQSIESSDSQFSYEMRNLIRQKIEQKKSDEQIKSEIAEEFGEDILLSSSVNKNKLIFAVFIFAVLIGFFFFKKF